MQMFKNMMAFESDLPFEASSLPSEADVPLEIKLKLFLFAAALRKSSNFIKSGSSWQTPCA